MFEAERKGEGLFFMRTQAAIKAATVSPDQLFGDWTLLKEFEKPLCKLTLSNASAGGESYKVVLKGGCDASITGFGPSTWRLQDNELIFPAVRAPGASRRATPPPGSAFRPAPIRCS